MNECSIVPITSVVNLVTRKIDIVTYYIKEVALPKNEAHRRKEITYATDKILLYNIYTAE